MAPRSRRYAWLCQVSVGWCVSRGKIMDMLEGQGTTKLAKNQLLALVFLLIISTSAGFIGGWIGSNSRGLGLNVNDVSDETKQQIVLSESSVISEIAKNEGPSVVSVNSTRQGYSNDFFGFSRPYSEEGAGTGIIISDDGYIVTNRHVVPSGVTKVTVVLSDGTELDDVTVVGRTSDSDPLDVAFLKIGDKKGKELKAAKLGDSSKVQVGDKVIAIGNALGQFQNTVTAGIISGYGRTVTAGDESTSETLQNLFQTDAAINPGNSGGPLVNINGEVIGINTAVAGYAENIGFAIPINDISGLIKSVLETGKLSRPYLGVRYVSLTDDIAFQYELGVKRGAYIVPSEGGEASILAGSPAEKAGLKEGDVIIKVNEHTVDDKNSLVSVLGRFKVGESVTITIHRDGSEMQLQATLEAAPEN